MFVMAHFMRHSLLPTSSVPAKPHARLAFASLVLLTTIWAPGVQAQTDSYSAAPLPPISSGTVNRTGEYVIPGTRARMAGEPLPSPKKLKKPDDLPGITLPANGQGVYRAAPSIAVSPSATPRPPVIPHAPVVSAPAPRPVYPVPPRLDQAGKTVEADSSTVTVIPVQPSTVSLSAMPFGKPSAPLTPQEVGVKPANVREAPIKTMVAAPQPVIQPQAEVRPAQEAPQVHAVETAAEKPLPWRRVDPAELAVAPMASSSLTPAPVELPAAPAPSAPVALKPQAVREEVLPLTPQPVATPEPVLPVTPQPLLPQGGADVSGQSISQEQAARLIPQEILDAPATAEAVPVAPVVETSPPLSEKSLQVLKQTPRGIDSPKQVIARTPKPVIIKRENPDAGTIPAVDVRAHEEMGLKIEVRRADPNLSEYLEQGYDNLIAGRYEIAAGFYQEVLKIEKNNELALFGLGTTYQKMGRIDEARDQYAHLLAINPTHREALNNFMALIAEESPDEAISELLQVEKQNPDFSPVPAQLGVLYSKTGQYDLAAEKLARALNLSPDNVSYKYNLAIALDRLGAREKASDLYAELIEDYKKGEQIPGDINMIRNRIIFLNQQP